MWWCCAWRLIVCVRFPPDARDRIVAAGKSELAQNGSIWTPEVAHRFGELLRSLTP